MDLTKLTMGRRTVHNYHTEKVNDTLVEAALGLSLWAPNHRLTFPWAYFWTGDKTRAQLAELNIRLKEAKGPQSEIKKNAARANITNPSHLILMATVLSDPATAHEDYATLACSVQIASLFLWQHQIGTKWSTGGHSTHADSYEILGISSKEYRLQGALMIGVPSIVPPAPPRPPLDKFLRKLT